MVRTNTEVAALLEELAELTELEEGDPNSFRARAYHNAARAVAELTRDVAELSERELAQVHGIGPRIAAKIREYVTTGRIRKLEELRTRHPPGERELLRIPGIGPKTVRTLVQLGIRDVDALRAALDSGRLKGVRGFGARTEDKLRHALEQLTTLGRRTPIADALPLARRWAELLREVPGVVQVEVAGSLRRFCETIGDVDIVVAASTADVADAVVRLPRVGEVLAHGHTKVSVRTTAGLQVDVRIVPPESFGAALMYFTGSKAHNIRMRQRAIERGWTLNEYALSEGDRIIAAATEEDIYRALDLPFIPPELREDSGEIEAAEAGRLPELVAAEDLRGDLHDHTVRSGDGRMTLDELVAAARQRGLEYVAVTEHAEDLRINGISREEMQQARRDIEAYNRRLEDLRLLYGAELNIGPDGSLDYDAEFRRRFDWCVASIHSHFDLPAAQQTERVIRAARDPTVHAIGHLTGRRIGRRPGVELDLDRVLDALAETGTALEANGNLDRLDAAAEVLREAVARGVTVVISSDAHAPAELDNLRYGAHHARRGWVPRDAVANTWPTERFLEWLERR